MAKEAVRWVVGHSVMGVSASILNYKIEKLIEKDGMEDAVEFSLELRNSSDIKIKWLNVDVYCFWKWHQKMSHIELAMPRKFLSRYYDTVATNYKIDTYNFHSGLQPQSNIISGPLYLKGDFMKEMHEGLAGVRVKCIYGEFETSEKIIEDFYPKLVFPSGKRLYTRRIIK